MSYNLKTTTNEYSVLATIRNSPKNSHNAQLDSKNPSLSLRYPNSFYQNINNRYNSSKRNSLYNVNFAPTTKSYNLNTLISNGTEASNPSARTSQISNINSNAISNLNETYSNNMDYISMFYKLLNTYNVKLSNNYQNFSNNYQNFS